MSLMSNIFKQIDEHKKYIEEINEEIERLVNLKYEHECEVKELEGYLKEIDQIDNGYKI